MLKGEGGQQEGKCGGKGADRGRNWKETERTPQEEMERSLLRLYDVNYVHVDSVVVQCLLILNFTSTYYSLP